jgi:hypothetical protein
LSLAATLYGPPGSARYFLAFQNPAELRGTGGLIGQYGVLESGPRGPRLTRVESYTALDQRTRGRAWLPAEVARRYGRFAVDHAWSAVNIPPDVPTVGRIVADLYWQTTGTRIDGMIAVDPLAVAEILRVSGPITVDGIRMDAGNVAAVTLVDAYVRYVADNNARHAFLARTAMATFAAFQRALVAHPDALVRALAVAASGRHLQVYSGDPIVEQSLLELGIGRGRVGVLLSERRDRRAALQVRRVDAGRGGVEEAVGPRRQRRLQHVGVDQRVVADDLGLVGLDVADPAHIGGQMVDVVHPLVASRQLSQRRRSSMRNSSAGERS